MKNRNDLTIITLVCLGTALIYQYYKQHRHKKQLQAAIHDFHANKDTTLNFLKLYKHDATSEIASYLALSYYKKGMYHQALKYTKSDKVRYECYIHLREYRNAIIAGFRVYINGKDRKMQDKLKMVTRLYVNEQIKGHEVKCVSVIAYKEFFCTFPLLFQDFEWDDAKAGNENKHNNDVKTDDDKVLHNSTINKMNISENVTNETEVEQSDHNKNEMKISEAQEQSLDRRTTPDTVYSEDIKCEKKHNDVINQNYTIDEHKINKNKANRSTLNVLQPIGKKSILDIPQTLLSSESQLGEQKANEINFKTNDTLKDRNILITSTTDKHIKKSVYTKIKDKIENAHIEGLKRYVRHRSDNLSKFIQISIALIENKMDETYTKDKLFTCYKTNVEYEHKIYIYCTLLLDFYNKSIATYTYQDISTMFYTMKLKKTHKNSTISAIMKCGHYPFVFHNLLQQSFDFVDDAYKAFPTDPQILSLACEIYISAKEYEKADDVISNLNKYCNNDPRTFICMFYKSQIASNNGVEYLKKALSLDDKYFRTYILLANYYKETGSKMCLEYFRKAKKCCNDYDALAEIFEAEVIEEVKLMFDIS